MVRITILNNTRGQIEGDFDSAALDEHLAFRKSKFWWKSPAAKKGRWDGKTHLYHKDSGTFPLGLLNTIKKWLRENGVKFKTIDQRPPNDVTPRSKSPKLKGITLRKDQKRAIRRAVKKERGIIWGSTGSGKTEVAAGIIKRLNTPITLFITGRKKLARQTRERLATRLGIPIDSIGFLNGGKWHDGSSGIYVAVMATLQSKTHTKKRSKLMKSCQLLILDEAHHAGSTTWYRTMRFCRARYRYGLTGTPVGRSDSGDLYLRAATGGVIVRIKASTLIKQGILAEPEIVFTRVRKPKIVKSGSEWAKIYKLGIVENDKRNALVAIYTKKLLKHGKRPLILVKEIEHGTFLEQALTGSKFLHGSLPDHEIDESIEAFEQKSLDILIATSIFDEGIDIPQIDVLVVASGGKSVITTLQRIGRGLRRKAGDNRLFVFDFVDHTNEHLLKHSQARIKTCRGEGFKVTVWDKPGQVDKLVA